MRVKSIAFSFSVNIYIEPGGLLRHNGGRREGFGVTTCLRILALFRVYMAFMGDLVLVRAVRVAHDSSSKEKIYQCIAPQAYSAHAGLDY